jgi:hypothetical protein
MTARVEMTTTIELKAPGRLRVAIAQRVADAHRGIDDASLCSFVSGSTVDDLADARSDIDMSVVFAALPDAAVLRAACRHAGGAEWSWQRGDTREGLVVSFDIDGIEVQIGYSNDSGLAEHLDEVLVKHNPDTPSHKMAEGVLKAVPLAGAERVLALQARLAAFPAALGRAMVLHGLAAPLSWRGTAQIIHRDTALWCRDVQVDACYRMLLILCGLNRRYFTRFQVKRVHALASKLAIAPPALADRIEALLSAPPREAFDAVHVLEGEVLDLIAAHLPDVDLSDSRRRWLAYAPS